MKLQSNFTTPEQSKRLIELGVPAGSADMVQVQDEITTDEYILVLNNDNDNGLLFEQNTICVPIWSVGRLIEIYAIITGKNTVELYVIDSPIKEILYMIEALAQTGGLDFSKLEE